ncbi:MAG: glycosyltransferase family 4 protein [Pseudomonadota bacterium]
MKIAYVLNTYPAPSQSFIRREIRALEALGHEVVRLAMRPAEQALVDPQDLEEARQTVHVLAQPKAALLAAFARAVLRDFAALRQAWALALRLGKTSEVGRLRHLIYLVEAAFVAERCRSAGVTHAHAHFGTNATAVALLSAMLSGPSYSFTVHGPEEFDAPRALSLGTKIQHAAFTVAISQFGRSQLYRWADAADWERIKVVHCGIEPGKFDDPQPIPEGPCRLVAIGRLVEQKGQLALIQALAQAQGEIHLTLIGDGDMRAAIEGEITARHLTSRVTLTGWVDEGRIKEELARAHALVMPSFGEGLPMVIMEAMAAARPVIATYIAGAPELVLHKETGWLIPAGDIPALAAAMDDCARTPRADLAAMGDRGRERVLARHDIAQEAAKLAKFMAG